MYVFLSQAITMKKSDHVVEPTRNQQFGVLIMAPKDNQPM